MRTIPASHIVFDMNLYPRKSLDEIHVSRLMAVRSTGATFPPVVVCAKTMKLVDGFHRVTTEIRMFGSDAPMSVIEKEYSCDRELFLDAIKFNAAHGIPLSDDDRKMCMLRVRRLGGTEDDIALSLSVSRESACRLIPVAVSANSQRLQPPVRERMAREPVKHVAAPLPPKAAAGPQSHVCMLVRRLLETLKEKADFTEDEAMLLACLRDRLGKLTTISTTG